MQMRNLHKEIDFNQLKHILNTNKGPKKLENKNLASQFCKEGSLHKKVVVELQNQNFE